MKRSIVALCFWLGLAGAALAQTTTWPPPAGFVAIYPPVGATFVNCGGSIASGGTAQQLFSAAQYKQGFLFEVGANDSNTDALYLSAGPITLTPGAGVAGSFSILASTSTAPGGSLASPLNFPPGQAWFVNGATTGDKFKCYVW